MDPQYWQRLETLFLRLEELSPAERQRFLDRECRDEPEMRRELEGMLGESEQATQEQDWIGKSIQGAIPVDLERIPERLGRYRIIGEIGRGGLATVLAADRDDQEYNQRVAIKLIRRGLDTDDLLRRLRQERQILARLQHPNIAALIDGGSTDDGRPYVVMEHIEGRPIDEFCAELPLRRRLELFVRVCEAVQYAHRNLVIHRDIKPANILVTAEGQPKLLDFGIAKLVQPGIHQPENAALTIPGSRWLTPEYASPEQLRGELLTTATDVYSLGVLLFEMLTGERPYAQHSGSREELAEAVYRLPVERPSSRIRTVAGNPADRLTDDGRRRARMVAGDLDNIVLMALRKEPERRYGSVEQLAEDVRRYLQDLPVRARPDSLGYRVGKFVVRHRWPVTIAAMSAILLMAISLIAVRQAQKAELQAKLAEQQAELAEQQAELARRKQEEAEKLQDFTIKIFQFADPDRSRASTLTVGELLDESSRRIQIELKELPVVRAKLMETIGTIFGDLGFYEKAREQFLLSVELRREQGDPLALAESLDLLGETFIEQGGDEPLKKAEDLFREGLELRRAAGAGKGLETAASYSNLGAVRIFQGKFKEAEEYWDRSLALRTRLLGEDHVAVAELYDNFGALRIAQRRPEEGIRHLERALEIRRRHNGPGDSETLRTEANLAAALLGVREFERAESLLRRALEEREKILGKNHPQVAKTLTNYATAIKNRGRFGEAEPLLRRAWEINRSSLGEDHFESTLSMVHLADGLADIPERLDEAVALYTQVWSIRRRLSPNQVSTAIPLESLGLLELDRGRPDAAVVALEEAFRIHRTVNGAAHPNTRQVAELLRRAEEAAQADGSSL